MRITVFANRNIKELLRDPLSYIFCLGFPVIMLLVMSAINTSIPPEANMTVFRIDNLSGGIAVFGLAFIMLFAALIVSKDRTSTFLTRLFASPMTAFDFIAGYYLPLLVLGLGQIAITYIASIIIGIVTGVEMSIAGMLLSMITLIPAALMFIGFGLIFGSILSDKAAPGICSIIVSAAAILGGTWMDVNAIGGFLAKLCNALPFFHAVEAARQSISGDYSGMLENLGVTAIYMAAAVILSVLAFRRSMKSDK